MDEEAAKQAGQIAAITLVIRQLVARLPKDEQDKMREFVGSRLNPNAAVTTELQLVMTAAKEQLDDLFTAATPG